ncbi:hypothetical protein IscW_ISCW008320 [Ixodes scapularis]|uniref:Uncharacterized protein n=1 Tax=Ixodes scapularis TaxID=6945 RepID=B7PWX4_IXOSC|nr:hypothetical protein IscW_ISCW008320 [Ixodes scapularis]|eukprot:XP_002410369.1 hypothetical protein IscW_ISCW008320 [Ixodes scapularis]
MSTSKHKEIVLETIDQLRKRKARPDFERICHMLYRRHGLTKVEVQTELDLLVDAEVVIKVDYKGSTSYRNAAKWVRFNKSPLSDPAASAAAAANAVPVVAVSISGHATTQKVSRMIGDAVKDLWCARQRAGGGASNAGITASEVEAFLQSKEAGIRLTKGALELAFEKEVAAGRLVRFAGGSYGLSDAEKQRLERCNAAPKVAPASCSPRPSKPPMVPREPLGQPPVLNGQSAPAAVAARPNAMLVVPEKRVAVAAPLINCNNNNGRAGLQGPAGKRARPLSKRKASEIIIIFPFWGTAGSQVYFACPMKRDRRTCYLTPSVREEHKKKLLRECALNMSHPSCLNYSPELVNVAQLSSWQCIDCKTCAVCNTNTDSSMPLFTLQDDLLVCDNCDKGYHPTCHKPKIANKPIGMDSTIVGFIVRLKEKPGSGKLRPRKTVLRKRSDGKCAISTAFAASSVNVRNLFEQRGTCRNVPAHFRAAYFTALDQYPDTIPDAKCWSIDEVEKFLVHVGFPEQASAFREQEIDGRSLLLLKRSDVLTGLSIKLGPALKIYNHIKRLQTGLPNGHLY